MITKGLIHLREGVDATASPLNDNGNRLEMPEQNAGEAGAVGPPVTGRAPPAPLARVTESGRGTGFHMKACAGPNRSTILLGNSG